MSLDIDATQSKIFVTVTGDNRECMGTWLWFGACISAAGVANRKRADQLFRGLLANASTCMKMQASPTMRKLTSLLAAF